MNEEKTYFVAQNSSTFQDELHKATAITPEMYEAKTESSSLIEMEMLRNELLRFKFMRTSTSARKFALTGKA